MTVECGLQLSLVPLLLNSHTEDIRGTLQESDIMLAKLTLRSAVNFEHTERQAVALQNDVHCTTDSMFEEQFRSSEPLFVFEMIGNHGVARLEGVASRRTQIRADGRFANYTIAPADARANEQTFFCRNVLQDFAEFSAKSLGHLPRGVIEHLGEARTLQSKDSEFGKQLLLANAQTESAASQAFPGLVTGFPLHEGFACLGR
jgi:hypothetical protein